MISAHLHAQRLAETTGRADLLSEKALDSLLVMFLAGGGDSRIVIGPDGRNPYGAPARPPQREIWFASCTASPISARGWRAASSALPRAFDAAGAENWFDSLRGRLLALLAPPGAGAALCASGAQAEFAALVLARALDGALARPVVNILVGRDETGRGSPLAASGKHFLDTAPFGPAARGERITGWEAGDISLETIDLRDSGGAPIPPEEVEAQAEKVVEAALARGARVLLHVMDCSKTGLAGPSRDFAAQMRARAPDDVCVVVDACQLRCAPAQIRADLEAGFLVMVTGSKFAGGPAFSGALLIPPIIMAALDSHRAIDWPAGLAAHCACLDWPAALRTKMRGPFGALSNPGLGLRWEAALAELEPFCALDPALPALARKNFAAEARRLAALAGAITDREDEGGTGILTLFGQTRDNAYADAGAVAQRLRRRGFFLGQKVALGGADALRLCLSAPQIVDFSARCASGGVEEGLAPLLGDLRRLFAAWRACLAS